VQHARERILSKNVQALPQIDGFRHFKELLPTSLGALFAGENARTVVGVEAEDRSGIAEAALIAIRYFQRPSQGVFLERSDQLV